MSRAPFQVLVLPFHICPDGSPRYALFRRTDGDYWQGIAGGGEGCETPLEAARREACEETGIDMQGRFFPLEATATIPVPSVCGFLWGPRVLVIPEYSFGALVNSEAMMLSAEHAEYRWCNYEDAHSFVKWDSNRVAIWELNHRVTNAMLR